MNQKQLTEKLQARHPDLTDSKAHDIVADTLEIIAQSVARGESVTLKGFGTFRRVKVGMKDVVPPRQGMVVQPGMTVNEHYRAAFRAGEGLARLVWPNKKPASVDDWGDEAQ